MRNSSQGGFSRGVRLLAWLFGMGQWTAALALSVWLLAWPPLFGLYYPPLKLHQETEDARSIVDWLAGREDLAALQAAVKSGHLSQKELDHFADVRELFSWMPFIFGGILVACAAALAVVKPSREWFWAAQKRGLILFGAALLSLGLVGLWDWKLLFAWIHYPFFGAASWKLPNASYSLQLFPMIFWQLMSAVFLAVAMLLSGALVWGMQRLVSGRQGQSLRSRQRGRKTMAISA
jgi:hypothetical protein